ncbi:MAG: lytic transglycosylase domain-containing protein [Bdellovibrionales bacterium]|nr:lytic transglycosylase domain-containing protein [Bdellovibrionales bacterium]
MEAKGLVWSLGALVWLVSPFASQSARALSTAPDWPRLKVPNDAFMTGCLSPGDAVVDGYFVRPATWTLTCPVTEFVARLQKEPPESPALRLLAGKVLHKEVLRVRSEIGRVASAAQAQRGLFDIKLLDVFQEFLNHDGVSRLPPPTPFESPEGKTLAQTQSMVETAELVLKPLFAAPGVLSAEGFSTYVRVLGDSLRFDAAASALNSGWTLLTTHAAKKDLLRDIMEWVEVYGAPPLRPWLRTALETFRPGDIAAGKAEALSYWLRSLELAGTPADKAQREFALDHLRELWVAFPLNADAQRIRRTAERIEVSKEFSPPGLKEMTLPELITRAQAQVRVVDSAGALRTIRRVLSMPKKDLDADKLWAALQLHARILRITDQREQIPEMLKQYFKIGRMLDPPTEPDQQKKFYDRAIELARMVWSYDKQDRAEEFTDRFLQMVRAPGHEAALSQFLYLKARIVEQKKDKSLARAAFAAAIAANKLPSDLSADLQWRNLLLHFDLIREGLNPADLLALFDPMKKILADPVDRARWHYWHAQAFALSVGKVPKLTDKDVVQEFEKSYKAEPYSFYSNLSGLELARLGHKPSDWVLGSRGTYHAPHWSDYWSDALQPKLPVYRDFARTYALASIGDFDGAVYVAQDIDAAIWDRLLSSKSAVKNKRAYARAVAWLRLAMLDSIGSLRVAEAARQAYGADFEEEDFLYLYPLPYWDTIQAEAAVRQSNPWLAASLIRQESAFNPVARSGANALGLMQMIPSVAQAEAKSLGMKDFIIQNLYDPAVALKLGVSHLANRVKDMGGSWICATAAYNAGAPPVKKWLANYDYTNPVAFIERISFMETRNYVRAILRNYMNYRRIYASGDFDLETIVKMPRSAEGLTRNE